MNVRYSRQANLQPIGKEGQEKISRASVVITGCGAVGSAAAELLAHYGIGRLRIIDRDTVTPEDPQGKSLFTEKGAVEAIPRAVAVAEAARRINPDIQVEAFPDDITRDSITGLCEGFDLLLDGLNNSETRFLVNEFSVTSGIPWVVVSFSASGGLSRLIVPGKTPCLRCLFPEDPSPGVLSSPSALGLENSVVQAAASFQVALALGIIVDGKVGREVRSLDITSGQWRSVVSEKGPEAECPCCQHQDFPYLDGRISGRVTSLCGDDAVQIYPAVREKVLNLPELAERLGKKNILRCNDYLLQAHIDGYELTVFSNGRAIIKGVKNQVEARSVYSRFIGN